MSEREPVCFTCGSSVETPLQNVLPTGRPCRTCRERVLESLPALLPSARTSETSDADEEPAGEAFAGTDEPAAEERRFGPPYGGSDGPMRA